MYYNWPIRGTGSRAKIHDRPCSLQVCAFNQEVDAGKVAAHQDFLRSNNNSGFDHCNPEYYNDFCARLKIGYARGLLETELSTRFSGSSLLA